MIMVIVFPLSRLGGIGEGPGMRSKEFIFNPSLLLKP
jgi:hypothetical protein